MEHDEPLLSIGELARRTGLPVRTIRFWSDAGVLPPAARAEGGRRLYDAACAGYSRAWIPTRQARSAGPRRRTCPVTRRPSRSRPGWNWPGWSVTGISGGGPG